MTNKLWEIAVLGLCLTVLSACTNNDVELSNLSGSLIIGNYSSLYSVNQKNALINNEFKGVHNGVLSEDGTKMYGVVDSAKNDSLRELCEIDLSTMERKELCEIDKENFYDGGNTRYIPTEVKIIPKGKGVSYDFIKHDKTYIVIHRFDGSKRTIELERDFHYKPYQWKDEKTILYADRDESTGYKLHSYDIETGTDAIFYNDIKGYHFALSRDNRYIVTQTSKDNHITGIFSLFQPVFTYTTTVTEIETNRSWSRTGPHPYAYSFSPGGDFLAICEFKGGNYAEHTQAVIWDFKNNKETILIEDYPTIAFKCDWR